MAAILSQEMVALTINLDGSDQKESLDGQLSCQSGEVLETPVIRGLF
ncbi:MAG: hypothetical protein R3175_09090 [Marinobacter sp.]|nr:hypothetical protein [Marinobacter sp.]MDX1756199.1 hypothetical protein [Marinobacter sp.]